MFGLVVDHLAHHELGNVGVLEQEFHLSLHQGPDGLGGGGGTFNHLGSPSREAGDDPPKRRLVQLFLAVEVVVEEGRVEPRFRADLLDSGRAETLPREKGFGGIKDLIPGGGRRGDASHGR